VKHADDQYADIIKSIEDDVAADAKTTQTRPGHAIRWASLRAFGESIYSALQIAGVLGLLGLAPGSLGLAGD
jgi:hypothetical protein